MSGVRDRRGRRHTGGPGDRRGSDFESLRDILEHSPAMKLIREYGRLEKQREAWRQVAGESVARESRITRYSGGRLTVEVFSAPLLLELSSFRKAELVESLRRTDPFHGIVDITFRSGQS